MPMCDTSQVGHQRRLSYVRTRSAYRHKVARQRACEHFAFEGKTGKSKRMIQVYRLRPVDIAASGFDRLRAHSMNTVASGLNVRFFNVTIPTGRDGTGNSMGRALSARRLPLNLKNDPGSIVRKRPVPTSALCN